MIYAGLVGLITLTAVLYILLHSQPVSNTIKQHSPQPTDVTWWKPSPGTSWQWQLSGVIDPTVDVKMYDIDLFDASPEVIDQLHREGRVVICYFSAGTFEDWRMDEASFPKEVLGNPLTHWSGERWLDIRQVNQLEPIMSARLDLAVQKNCDGVEPDNVDAYENETGFPLT